MSEIQESAALPEPAPAQNVGLEDLPPVQPPSAGFIMQLFLIPAIIVGAVIGVWVMFGKLAGTQQDWGQLVQDLGSENEHRRWRAASGLAHMLNTDRERFKSFEDLTEEQRAELGEQTPLATNPKVASELVGLFERQLQKKSKDGKHVTHQEFLATTIGSLDLPDTVLPALQKATEPTYNAKVRTSALRSIALILNRAEERGEPIKSLPELTETLIDATATDNSEEESGLVKQVATYALGLVKTEESQSHLVSLLANADEMTQINAAIALTRVERTEGVEVFLEVLDIAKEKFDPKAMATLTEPKRLEARNRYQIEIPMMLNNSLKALDGLASKLTAEQKSLAIERLKPVAANYEHTKLRKDAELLLDKLK